MRKVAVELALRGFKIFPLRPGDKRPRFKGWQESATDCAATLLETFPSACNPGILTTGYVILDADVSKSGLEAAARLNLPPTLTTRTASGGLHYYFRAPPGTEFATRACVYKADGTPIPVIPGYWGIDVRAKGGLVVGPGGVVNGKTYTIENYVAREDIPFLPQHVAELLKAAPERAADAGQAVVPVDTPDTLARAAAYLQNDAAQQVLAGARGATTLLVANRLGDFGVSVDTALQIMQPWNERCCVPPQDDDEYTLSVQHAFEYRQDPIGRDHPLRWYEEVELLKIEPGLPSKDAPDHRLGFIDEITDEDIIEDAKNALIRGLMTPGENGVIYGDSGAGKTFVALDLAYHLAHGFDWHGHRVRRAVPVLYINYESMGGFKKRMRAIRKSEKFKHLPSPLFFSWARHSEPLGTSNKNTDANQRGADGLARTIDDVKRLEALCGMKVGLVVIDTLRRANAGGDENATEAMMAFIQHRAKEIQEKTGAYVLIVHHENKSGGMAGNNSLKGASEMQLHVKKKDDGVRVVTAQKVKDDLEGHLFDFKLKPIVIGTFLDDGPDPKPVKVDSCVVEKLFVQPKTNAQDLLNMLAPIIGDELSLSAGAELLKEKMGLTANLDDLRKELRSVLRPGQFELLGKPYIFTPVGECGGLIRPVRFN